MKILQVNRYFYMHGGSERYFLEVSKLLEKYGHEIAFFSMEDNQNRKSKWNKYFVSNISLDKITLKSALKIISRMIYSIESQKNLSKLLDDFKPDIVHLHILDLFISPSIIFEIAKRNIPIVQTLHGCNLLAPTRGGLFHDGAICEVTKKHSFYKAIFHKCIKQSYLVSSAFAITYYIHHFLRVYNKIDYFITPTFFLRNKYIDYGFNTKKVVVLSNFVRNFTTKNKHDFSKRNYILYFGRLSPEKGLLILVKALQKLPKIKLVIAGNGSQLQELVMLIKKENINNIKIAGFHSGINLKKLIAKSSFSLIPSICYENQPLSILESFVSKKPVIASNIGGLPEIVKNGYTGFLFEPGNADDLSDKISKLWNNPVLCRKLGRNAREYVEENFGPEEHYEKLMKIYNMAIGRH